MEKSIQAALMEIERARDVRILYACEAGSRAWGTAGSDSDYDVRAIYMHPLEWYLSIEHKQDYIDVYAEKRRLDIHGWEIRKALQLLNKSTPSLLKWLQSSIVYRSCPAFVSSMRMLARKCFSPKACIYHYLHMAERNYRKMRQQEAADVKSYFYILRLLLTCKHIENHRAIPPLEFQALLKSAAVPPSIVNELEQLLILKFLEEKRSSAVNQKVLHHFIEQEIGRMKQIADSLQPYRADYADELNRLFRQMLIKDNDVQ